MSALTCDCCGAPIENTDRIDIGSYLPDDLASLDERRIIRDDGGLVRHKGVGHFVRCILEVRLTGGVLLALGIWILVDKSTYERCRTNWNDPSYLDLVIDGTLASELAGLPAQYGAPVTARPVAQDQLPYVTASSDPRVNRIRSDTWDRDEVLSSYDCPLPIAVRTRLSNGWTVERSAALERRFGEDGLVEFYDDIRSVGIETFQDTIARTPEETLREFLHGDSPTPEDQHRTWREGPELRNTFWAESMPRPDGGTEAVFFGQVIRNGDIIYFTCAPGFGGNRAWAEHVFRSLTAPGAPGQG
ncbi:DUF2199 domain-containing protein [Mycolicibacterium brumae]|uniref:DUF2199 domain-containing protein n=1 Tax=Mycolicibacterium brumae TaxID=85968 RepID=A0A2G5PC47_9MYCO|nr:DUF2199 domain-containing protein [Mycolicibacterium brumae]MCV7193165.1 DUF2199 domain-containing protein [Mycolicibacterium brumae]PIB75922.1 DUF2199 domain-containing protein [Mycolicibacterium brumae]RWA16604.1 hypothetical protein MBRU_07725 [Mycolicibacterium brumae DSM 44177]UWW09820.1 DUF2199 domain-containing protein [Mycolicibacterium brumae]